MTGDLLAQIASNALALAIAMIGWVLHVRTCRATITALQQENRRLVEALARSVENGGARDWRRAP